MTAPLDEADEHGTSRPYHSPLRDAQAAQTRTHILDTLVRLLADGGADGFATRDLAASAGIAERTVYRYFPDRAALLDGLNEHLSARTGPGRHEEDLDDLDDLVEHLPTVFRTFDERAEVTKASVLLNPDPGRLVPKQQWRTEHITGLARRSFPDLPAEQQELLGAMVRTVSSTYNWLRLREEFGLSGDESGRLLGWVIGCAIDDVRRTGRVGGDTESLERPT